MLLEIDLDVLHFLDRTVLEGLQMHNRYLRDLVDRHARTLPLRYIHYFWVMDGEASMTRAPGAEDWEKVFRRADNAFIRRLELNFQRENIPLLHYLRTNANGVQCQVKTLSIVGADFEIDYGVVDFLGIHLKPQVYETSMVEFRGDYALLFAHNALRGSVKHLEYKKMGGLPAPNCIIPALFGVDVVETCLIKTQVDPRPWIGKFIEMFETAERGTDTVRSVTLLHERWGEVSPLRHTVEPLGQPRRSDAPTPNSAYIKEWCCQGRPYGSAYTESTDAKLFVFENAKSSKKLEVFVWTLDEEYDYEEKFLHYVFLLRVVDMLYPHD